MKKLIYSIIFCAGAFAFNSVNAQTATFTTPNDTVKVAVYTSVNAHSDITNITSSNIKLEWTVTENNFPQEWTKANMLGICDNVLCRVNANNQLLDGTKYTTNDYIPGAAGDFYIQLTGYDNSIPGTYYAKVNFKDIATGYSKDVVFVFNKWTTNVNNISSVDDNINLYPNPAKESINVTFDKNLNVDNIAVYNLVGKRVNNYRVTAANSAKLNLEDMPSGIYFVRLIDKAGSVVATRRFTHR